MISSRLGLLLALAILVAGAASAAEPQPRVLQIDLDAVIHPLSVEIVQDGLMQAAEQDASAVLIRLDTPGGLLAATQQIIQAIVASEIPVITYVAPSGGRAASAGFLILMAGDVAAMAPGTNTGAAHPVPLGGQEMDEITKQKAENDVAASVRAVTEKRGRNAELAEEAVLESKAFTEEEALEHNLIDVIAADTERLIEQLDGRTVIRFDGEQETLRLEQAVIEPYELSLRQRVLLPLIDPSLAFVLLMLGALGVYVEFSNPGLILPGVIGGVMVILGLMALSLLPINWAGAALLLLGVACLALEAFIISHGVLAIGGTVAMTLGAVMLIDAEVPQLQIGWGVALAVSVPFALITVFLLQLAVRAFRYKVATGSEGMIGEVGVAKTAIGEQGRVFVHGELWRAHSSSTIPAGVRVRVTAVEGLLLEVQPLENQHRPTPPSAGEHS